MEEDILLKIRNSICPVCNKDFNNTKKSKTNLLNHLKLKRDEAHINSLLET
jgi:DNA repair exonuclease SbcCD ATPase subunit